MKDNLVPILGILCVILAVALAASFAQGPESLSRDKVITQTLGAENVVAKQVSARRISLVDEEGRERIVLVADDADGFVGATIEMLDALGRTKMKIQEAMLGNRFELSGPNGETRIVIDVFDDGRIRFFDADGAPGRLLTEAEPSN